jgi:hypothetical protein
MTSDACACTVPPSLDAARDGRAEKLSQHPQRRLEDREFAAMELAYRRNGGLLSADAVARLLRARDAQPLSVLARWIVDRRILSIDWQSQLLVPTFQFEEAGMRLRPEVLEMVSELAPFLDDWALARWFAEPNSRLEHRAPVEALDTNPGAVLRAARAAARADLPLVG